MVFSEHTYSVLIVSSGASFAESLERFLPPGDFWPVHRAQSAGEARRSALELSYDLILINTPLGDEFGSSLAADICRNGTASVLLFVKRDIYDDVYSDVSKSGVMVASKPAQSQMITQTLRIMCSARERLRGMEAKQVSVEDKIKEIRLINKAKWALIECLNMTESEAHRYIEKQAMDMRLSKVDVARNVIKTYS